MLKLRSYLSPTLLQMKSFAEAISLCTHLCETLKFLLSLITKISHKSQQSQKRLKEHVLVP